MEAVTGEHARMFARYVIGLRSFFADPMTEAECHERMVLGLERDVSFLRLLDDVVFGHQGSPYRALLAAAGLGRDDVAGLVAGHGVEGALDRLFDAGVYVTREEFRGERPIERPGLHLDVAATDFDNPHLVPVLVGRSGGSRSGTGRAALLDLRAIAYEVIHEPTVNRGYGIEGRPYALWRPVPPGIAGLNDVLRQVKLRRPVVRWFSQSPVAMSRASLRHDLVLRATLHASRRTSTPLPRPEHVPVDRADVVARWIAGVIEGGRLPVVSTPTSGAVRICLAARDLGVDVAGTFFRTGAEPLTPARAEAVRGVGARIVCHYAMNEIGRVALACATPTEVDDTHLLVDKLAVIQREDSPAVYPGAFLFTTLQPTAKKVMINVESDDFGVVERRPCGCPLGQMGYDVHLHGIRSHEKLRSEGVGFLRTDVVRLLEHTLPARFGGDATDYQLVDDERGGSHGIGLLVSPRVGPLDEPEVVGAFLDALGSDSGSAMMTGIWRDGRTVRLVRREPYVTAAGKIGLIHVLR